MNKLWNVLLYPVRMYEKLTDNRWTLYAGIIFVGLVDFFLPDVKQAYVTYFTGKPLKDIQFNIITACLMVLLLGLIDTVFMSVPLFDIFNFFKKKEGLPHRATRIKVIKVYIMSHFLVIPVNVIFYYTVFRDINKNSSALMLNVSMALLFIVIIWAAAILTRGINTLFTFGPFLRRLTFIIVFTWSYLFSMVFDLQIEYWLFKIFK